MNGRHPGSARPARHAGQAAPAMLLRRCARWTASMLTCVAIMWSAVFLGLLVAAKAVHQDIGIHLPEKLGLLALRPGLIFAGDSRTEYQVDAQLAARLMGRAPGYAVNIAVAAGDPVSLLAALRQHADAVRGADLVVNVSPYHLNDGDRRELHYPMTAVARLTLGEQVRTFLPLHLRTLIRFIIEGFTPLPPARPAAAFSRYGSQHLIGSLPADRLRGRAGDDPVYAGWNLSGPKSTHMRAALCAMPPLVKRLVVVLPPWSAIYDKRPDEAWRRMDAELVALLSQTGRQCGFEVLHAKVPGLKPEHFRDALHINVDGVPIYTRYLLDELGYRVQSRLASDRVAARSETRTHARGPSPIF
jgi:hypothetical protein